MQANTKSLSPPWIVTATDPEGLRTRARQLRARLDAASDVELVAISSELLAEGTPGKYRAVALGGSRERLCRSLDGLVEEAVGGEAIVGEARDSPRVAFVFPPVRTEHEGMILDLLAASPTLRRQMSECEATLEPYAEWSLDDVLNGRPDAPSLYRLDVCQHALFAACTSLARLWERFGVRADAVLGHSFGEVPAATISGSLTVAEAARVISSWGRSAMRWEGRGEMAVIALPAAELADRIGPWSGRLWISAVNGPTSTSVSGEKGAVEELLGALAADGIGARPMGIRVPTHSPAVRVIYRWCDEELRGLTPRAGGVPFYSGVVGREVDQTGLDRLYWASNLAQRVHFEPALRALLADGYEILVEVGPRRMLAENLRETAVDAGVDAVIVGTVEQGDSPYLLRALAELFVNGVEVDWSAACGERPEIPVRFWSAHRDAAGEGGGARLADLLADLPEIEREAVVLGLVRAEVARAVGLGSAAEINPGRPFKDLGFDSPRAVDLRNRLIEATGLDLSTTIAFDYPTPRDVARKLLLELNGGEEAATDPSVSGPDEEAIEAIDELDLDDLIELGRRQRESL
jgi:pimaricinolide synthase PimS1